MAKEKNIILTKNRTRIEINSVDGWLYDFRTLVNGKEAHYCQILKIDVSRKIERLEKDGFIQVRDRAGLSNIPDYETDKKNNG